MYTAAGIKKGEPEHEYRHGCHNLRNEFGTRVITNLTGGVVTFYKNYSCTGPTYTIGGDSEVLVNISPINSIGLNPGF